MVCAIFDVLWEFQNEMFSGVLPYELATFEDPRSRWFPVLAQQDERNDVRVGSVEDTLPTVDLKALQGHMNLALDFRQ